MNAAQGCIFKLCNLYMHSKSLWSIGAIHSGTLCRGCCEMILCLAMLWWICTPSVVLLRKFNKFLRTFPLRMLLLGLHQFVGMQKRAKTRQQSNVFEWMQREGFCPKFVTFLCMLKAYGSIRAIHKREEIHDEIVKRGLL